VRADGATDAVSGINVRMLGPGPVGIKLAFFRSLARPRFSFLQLALVQDDRNDNNYGAESIEQDVRNSLRHSLTS
jgi:hypothetical protein